jgi:hypothetical protein
MPCKPSSTKFIERSFEVVEDNRITKTLEHEAKLRIKRTLTEIPRRTDVLLRGVMGV